MSSKSGQDDIREERARDRGSFIINDRRGNAPAEKTEEQPPSKDKVLFYLGRHLRAAEEKANVDLLQAAKEGKSYPERRAALEKTEEAGHEARALRRAFEYIRNTMPEK
jgi:hypothetical protein